MPNDLTAEEWALIEQERNGDAKTIGAREYARGLIRALVAAHLRDAERGTPERAEDLAYIRDRVERLLVAALAPPNR
jgi:hypothetical protein